jgi:ATP/maltotriose-dependent transcriptional regulator MalT
MTSSRWSRAIALDSDVSVSTAKINLKRIHRKLDVADRCGAVRRGRELRLLGPAP